MTPPIHRPRAPSDGRQEPRQHAASQGRSKRRGEGADTILVAEDDAGLRALISAALETSGYEVVAAANGFEALREAERRLGRIALLISDVMMPGMSGPELARRLRARSGPLKVLLLSGYPRQDLPADLGDLEPVLVEKPFSVHALARTVRGMLAAAGGEPAKG